MSMPLPSPSLFVFGCALLFAGCGSVGLAENAPMGGRPMAEVDPEGMTEFPDEPVGYGSSKDFTVQSVGDSPITVEDAWVEVSDPNVFFVGALPFPKRLDPGDSVVFQVNFEPQQSGIFYGTVVITMDDGSTLERNVTGAGCEDGDSDRYCD